MGLLYPVSTQAVPLIESLADRFDIDNAFEIDDNESARAMGWKNFVVPQKYRDILVALVEQHVSVPAKREQSRDNNHPSFPIVNTQVDLIRGKGQDRIILLHSPPGSGKTSTAETIAAFTGRLLYSITCGDIGSSP